MVVTEQFGLVILLAITAVGVFLGLSAGYLSAWFLELPTTGWTLAVDALFGLAGIVLTVVFGVLRYRIRGEAESVVGLAMLASASLPVLRHLVQWLVRSSTSRR